MRIKSSLTGIEPRRAVGMAALLILCLYMAAHVGLLFSKLDFGAADLGSSTNVDFFVYYSSARFLLDGGSLPSLYDPGTLKAYQVSLGAAADTSIHPFIYPPSYALLIKPFGLLPFAWSLIVWSLGTFALFLASLRLVGLRWVEILAVGAAPASALNFAAGQNGFLTSALLISAMALMAGRQAASGALLGILTVKPHLGLVIPFVTVAKRRWTAIAAALAGALALIAASTLVFGIEAWAGYLDAVRWFSAQAENQPLGTFFDYSSSVLMAAKIAQIPQPLPYLIQGSLSLFVFGAVYWAFRRKTDQDLLLALMLAGTAIATPYAFLYDMPFLALAVVLTLRHGLARGFLPYETLCLLSVFLAPFAGAHLNALQIPLVPVAHLAFFGYILVRLRAGLTAVQPPQRMSG